MGNDGCRPTARPTLRRGSGIPVNEWDAASLTARYDQVRDHTERLAAPLSPENQTVQSMADVPPTKWHGAHVTWFFETFVLSEHEAGFAPYQDRYWFLFNSYYESLVPRFARPDRGLVTRPGAHDVGVYRGNVDDRMRDLVATLDDGTVHKLSATIELGFHHEQQHQELLLLDIKHVLSHADVRPGASGECMQRGDACASTSARRTRLAHLPIRPTVVPR
ncbi:MAG: DinB family protein [Humibacillus sp.]